jgi:hypothetical protein
MQLEPYTDLAVSLIPIMPQTVLLMAKQRQKSECILQTVTATEAIKRIFYRGWQRSVYDLVESR